MTYKSDSAFTGEDVIFLSEQAITIGKGMEFEKDEIINELITLYLS